DPLFRSAALVYGPSVIGIVLSGALDDGTAGLIAVKRRGGIAIVQDPDDAQHRSMPASALAHVRADFVLPATEIAAQIVRSLDTPAHTVRGFVDAGMEQESDMARPGPAALQEHDRAGQPAASQG